MNLHWFKYKIPLRQLKNFSSTTNHHHKFRNWSATKFWDLSEKKSGVFFFRLLWYSSLSVSRRKGVIEAFENLRARPKRHIQKNLFRKWAQGKIPLMKSSLERDSLYWKITVLPYKHEAHKNDNFIEIESIKYEFKSLKFWGGASFRTINSVLISSSVARTDVNNLSIVALRTKRAANDRDVLVSPTNEKKTWNIKNKIKTMRYNCKFLHVQSDWWGLWLKPEIDV